MSKKMMLMAGALTVAAVGQIVLAIVLYDPQASAVVINTGWGILWLSAIFGWLPIYTFRKKGEVKGRGYIQTTKLVDSGVYAIVRHPQYLAGVLMSIALPLITQHWSVAALGVAAAVIYYVNTFEEEKGTIEKFGEAYKQYMQTVPRMNFILGIIRLIRRRLG